MYHRTKEVGIAERLVMFAKAGRAPEGMEVWQHTSGTGQVHKRTATGTVIVAKFITPGATLSYVPAFSRQTSAWKKVDFLPKDMEVLYGEKDG